MSQKLADLAEKLSIDLPELKKKIKELGFDISPRSRVIDDEIAELVLDELSPKSEKDEIEAAMDQPDEGDIVEIYDELISQEREREIVKSQRKKMAGKDTKGHRSEKSAEEKAREALVRGSSVEINDVITVKEFAEKTGIKIAKIIGELMKNGILANINQQIDFETAQIIADDLGIKLKRIRGAADVNELMVGDITNLLKEDDTALLEPRPPVVCVMGHVDHGKTKLLDAIREADVVSTESGGITQHVGAYQVKKKGKLITFLDTPGHEAFTSMRARGAKVTDIAILVVAADEGVKPQTVEAINHAKDAGVPIIVAMNKMDKPNVNLDKLKGELAEQGLQPEDWGGTTVCVPVSALTGKGIDELLDMILLTAEMENYKANPDRDAVGTVIEAHLDHSLGPVATILVNTGTLKLMDNVVIGSSFGRVKLMRDHNGKSIKSAPPSTPVVVAGLSATPKSGDILHAVSDEKSARDQAEQMDLAFKKDSEEQSSGLSQILTSIKSDKILKIILKTDTKGSLEAIKQSIAKVKDEDVAVKIIHSGVGTVTESDVMMASASGAVVMAFHSDFDSPYVGKTAEREKVVVRKFKIIYDLLTEISALLTGLLEPEIIEIVLGRCLVKQVFLTKKKEMIIGCKVMKGKVINKSKLRVIRGKDAEGEELVVGKGYIESLRRSEEAIAEIAEGNDCGIKFTGNVKVEEGDILEAYKEEEKRRVIS